MALPPTLLGYQRRWMADESRVRVWEKSRRIGASWVVAAESVVAAARINGGRDTWYTSYNKETTAEFIRDCGMWCGVLNAVYQAATEEYITDEETGEDILTYVIRFPTGHKITALSSRPTNLRNRKGRIIVDEAAHVTDLEATLKAAMAILMWGGGVDILSTHNGVASAFNKLVEDIKATRKDYSLHRTDLDDAIEDGLFKRICLVNNWDWSVQRQQAWREELIRDYGDDAAEELFCVPQDSGGAYLDRMVIEDSMHSGPVLRFEAPDAFASRPDHIRAADIQSWLDKTVAPQLSKLPSGLMHTFGEDFGRTADLTVIAPMTLCQDLTRKVPFLIELRDVPFREQEQVLNFVVDRLPRFVYGALDATGNGQYMAERAWQRYGEQYIEQVFLSERWYGENLPPMKAAFEDRLLSIVRDADVLSDLLQYQLINGIPKLPSVRTNQKNGTRKSVAKRHGDAGVAIALAHYASRQELPAYEYKSAKSTRRHHHRMLGAGGGFKSRSGGVL